MAVGGNAEGARLFGIATWRYVVLALALSGVLSAIGGILLALSLNTGAPIYGEQDLIIVIAAVLVGGTSLSGGRGSAMGTFAGVIFLSAITTGMNLSNVPVFWQSVTIGIVLIVVILVDGYYLRRQRTHSIRRLNPRVARAST
jgi:ribose/xylose/arabinose/galactoside ABC-type transport system permease subunit